MKQDLLISVFKSLRYSRKDSVYQVIIIALLSAIITGSFFTGDSVRYSLRKTSWEKLGNTDIIVRSGLRYFNSSLAERIRAKTGEKTVSILETDGYCQNFSDGATALNVKIYGIGNDFFQFNDDDSLMPESGSVAVNSRLAARIGIKQGNEIIIHFRQIDPIPSNAPFSPSGSSTGSKVMKVGRILSSAESGNFSTGLSQITPMNIFINIRDMENGERNKNKANVILIRNKGKRTAGEFQRIITGVISPSDIGLTFRRSEKTGETELISDRIFIDSAIVAEVEKRAPDVLPVLTYFANRITYNGKSTPYSFVSALAPPFLPDPGNDGIIINRWLAVDIGASAGDSITITWFDAGGKNMLREKERKFIVKSVINNDSKFSDPSLMPDFPGISGSTTCSGWDAGMPVILARIREKDEDYWKKYRGTPKAFISYRTGKEIWGNNFGSATALRFPPSLSQSEIKNYLKGSFDSSTAGFTVTDAMAASSNAAREGVDFSTLFLGLGLFTISACILLLIMAEATFFDSRRKQVKTFFCLGFMNRQIREHLIIESSLISLAGAIPGVFLGYFINILIIKALNSVWSGAVQTNTLVSVFSPVPLLAGFLTTSAIASVVILIMAGKFMKTLSGPRDGSMHFPSGSKNKMLLILFFAASALALIMSFLYKQHSVLLAFTGGSLLFAAMIIFLRYIIISEFTDKGKTVLRSNYPQRKYSFFHPGHIINPVIFIAAGIFAIIITGANKQVISRKDMLRRGGTGGYLLWAESALPVRENLSSEKGIEEFDLDDPELNGIEIDQFRRVTGDDASCLNLNHVTAPPLLGIHPSVFIARGSFSFSSVIGNGHIDNPWPLLDKESGDNVIYGIADQTSLEWSLKLKTGDTLKARAENGQLLKIVICAGLKSSLFQGYMLIGDKNLDHFFPSTAGSSVFLIDGNPASSGFYMKTLNDRLSEYGFSSEPAGQKLSSFFQVTNTYLEVFMVFGILGMILGTAGLGFTMAADRNRRKKEFALMMSIGYTGKQLRRMQLNDQAIILIWGILTGIIPALTATYPSIKAGINKSFNILIVIVISILITGAITALTSAGKLSSSSLSGELSRE